MANSILCEDLGLDWQGCKDSNKLSLSGIRSDLRHLNERINGIRDELDLKVNHHDFSIALEMKADICVVEDQIGQLVVRMQVEQWKGTTC